MRAPGPSGGCGAWAVRSLELRAGPRLPLDSGSGGAWQPAGPAAWASQRWRPFGPGLLRTGLHNRKPALVCFVLLSLFADGAEG